MHTWWLSLSAYCVDDVFKHECTITTESVFSDLELILIHEFMYMDSMVLLVYILYTTLSGDVLVMYPHHVYVVHM